MLHKARWRSAGLYAGIPCQPGCELKREFKGSEYITADFNYFARFNPICTCTRKSGVCFLLLATWAIRDGARCRDLMRFVPARVGFIPAWASFIPICVS
ncbi:MAG: hypothetical protein JWR07_361 [Nevskia sp.]|nr:hypothetical protein [Nevskia sp.]